MAICGKNCSITFGIATLEAHQFSIAMTGNEVDVTSFEDSGNDFGSWLSCSEQGTVTANMYEQPAFSIGDTVVLAMTFGYTPAVTLGASGVVTNISYSVDAKGIVDNVATFRLTGALS